MNATNTSAWSDSNFRQTQSDRIAQRREMRMRFLAERLIAKGACPEDARKAAEILYPEVAVAA